MLVIENKTCGLVTSVLREWKQLGIQYTECVHYMLHAVSHVIKQFLPSCQLQMCFINFNGIPTLRSHPKSFDHMPTLVTITSRKKMKTHLCAIKGCTTCNEGPCVTVCHSSDILPTWDMLPFGNMSEVSWFWVIRMSCKVQL